MKQWMEELMFSYILALVGTTFLSYFFTMAFYLEHNYWPNLINVLFFALLLTIVGGTLIAGIVIFGPEHNEEVKPLT